MESYEAYKDIGFEMIEKIPEHWSFAKLGYLLIANDGGVWGDDGGDTIVLRSTEINLDGKWNFEDEPAKRLLSKAELSKATLLKGDLLVTKSSGSKLHIGKTALVNEEVQNMSCCFSNFMQRLRLKRTNNPTFYFYFLNSIIAREQYNYLSNTTTGLANLGAEILSNLNITIPPPQEQTAIASYLDQKTTQIDELIADKERLLELYEEEKTAIINEAVTRGLDPDVPMKDSGIEWLGEIPEHWEVKKIKYVATINDEALSETTDEDFEIEYVEISNVKKGVGIIETKNYFFKDAPSRARRIVRDGDIIVSTVRTYLKSIAKVDNPPDNLIASTGFAVIRPRKLNSDFTGYLFYSEPLIGEIISRSTGVSYPAINASQIGDIFIPIPSDEEQKSIAHHIETECNRIDMQVERTQKLIELLTEYRTALISEVVTGKVKVV